MSYTGTQAQAGFGSTIAINTGSDVSPTWTLIGEVTGLKQSGTQNLTDDATNLNSTAKEFIPTILDPGSYDFSVNRVPADAGQVALLASFNAKTLVKYKIVLPLSPAQTTAGDSYILRAMVEKYPKTIDPAKIIKFDCTLKISGTEAFTAGS